MIHNDWIPEYVTAFEHYNDLLREAQRERLARLTAPPRRQTPWAVGSAARSVVCSLAPVRQTKLCTLSSLA